MVREEFAEKARMLTSFLYEIETGKKVGEIIYRQGSNLLYTIDIISRNKVQSIEFKPMIRKLTNNFLKL